MAIDNWRGGLRPQRKNIIQPEPPEDKINSQLPPHFKEVSEEQLDTMKDHLGAMQSKLEMLDENRSGSEKVQMSVMGAQIDARFIAGRAAKVEE